MASGAGAEGAGKRALANAEMMHQVSYLGKDTTR